MHVPVGVTPFVLCVVLTCSLPVVCFAWMKFGGDKFDRNVNWWTVKHSNDNDINKRVS